MDGCGGGAGRGAALRLGRHPARGGGARVASSAGSWPVDPEGLRLLINMFEDRYHLPQFIVENGIGLDENLDENGKIDDPFRVRYLEQHLKQVALAIEDGCNVMGYLWWGPIDVVSAGTGEMKKRYGFVYVDRFNDGHGTLERKIKNSYYRYKEIIESNGEVL